MTTRRVELALALALAFVSGCAPDAVVIESRFPTPSAFMQTTSGRLRIFPLTAEQLGVCPDLLDDLQGSSFAIEPIYDSERQESCWFRAGTRLPELGAGPRAYVVEMRSESNTLILQGCAVGEIYEGAGTIRIELSPTDDYDPAITVPGTPEGRCGGGS